MSIEKMREQFEHHIRKSIYGEQATNEKLMCLARNGYGYSDSAVCRDWMLWQASRAAIEVELPEWEGAADFHFSTPVMSRDAVLAAIEAAGLKVKGEKP